MGAYTGRPAATEHAPWFAGYVARIPDGDLVSLLREGHEASLALLRELPEGREQYAYAPGKWTIAELVGHLIDVERVMSYRALWFARGDAVPLPAFDENVWAPEGRFGERSLRNLLAEWTAVRASTVALFDNLPAGAWERIGTAGGQPLSVRAIACIIAGHERHHREILEARYGLGAPAAQEAGGPA